MDALVVDPTPHYACSTCARCCRAPWAIVVSDAEKEAIAALPLAQTGRAPEALFSRAGRGFWALAKADDGACVMLDPDNLCAIHKAFGEAAKPRVCQRFPFLHVASDERVWVTANYGCKAVQEGMGPPLEASRASMGALFAQDLAEADPGADTVYPVTATTDLSTPALDAAFDRLFSAMGERLSPALRQLAAFVESAPEPGTPATDAPAVGAAAAGPVRYAFALTLYADLVDQERFFDRLRGVVLLPRVLGFGLTYPSRFLGRPISMERVSRHPGVLPPESEALLLDLVRSRLRSRLVFKDVPTAAAGVTRLLLHVALVLYYARALAEDGPITHAHVLRGLEVVELLVANQAVLSTLSKLDPRLRAAWSDPAVARGAATLMAPA